MTANVIARAKARGDLVYRRVDCFVSARGRILAMT